MQRLLLRLLLLAVCFNAAIGLPLHQADHLRHDAAHLVSSLAHGAHETDGELATVHGACAWCTAHAAFSLPSGAPVAAAIARVDTPSAGAPPPAVVLSAAPVRWPFASRAPPLV